MLLGETLLGESALYRMRTIDCLDSFNYSDLRIFRVLQKLRKKAISWAKPNSSDPNASL
jgi:hypothetical protein